MAFFAEITLAVVLLLIALIYWRRHSHESAPQTTTQSEDGGATRANDKRVPARVTSADESVGVDPAGGLTILYGTQSGTAERLANMLAERLRRTDTACAVVDVADYDPDDLAGDDGFIVFIVATYTGGTPTPSCKLLYDWLMFERGQVRSGNLLRKLKYSVFGLGNSVYDDNFNVVGREMDRALFKLGAKRFHRYAQCDESADIMVPFDAWSHGVASSFQRRAEAVRNKAMAAQRELDRAKAALLSGGGTTATAEAVLDVEDLGSEAAKALGDADTVDAETKAAVRDELGVGEDGDEEEVDDDDDDDVDEADDEEEEAAAASNEVVAPKREMLSDYQKAELTKQGYKVIGSHSAVKMCRWTKAQMRGRGGCYKHTFYGITSYQCMEMTPSMACANKCVFCWRHHKNPVGKEFKWVMDEPEFLIEQAIEKHRKMVRTLKGMHGVIESRYKEALKPRHCALSLVGEPIMYPEINRFLDMLHQRRISSFLVSNAQFPDAITNLRHVTQLYVSVDGPNATALKQVDRPIFEDFWERYIASLDALRESNQRTVYRMTLVRGYNMADAKGYAELVRRGRPEFIEIKGVTYCGGKRNALSMRNVPWHDEVLQFARSLCAMYLDDTYGVACEHEHSCCVLLADRSKFYRDGQWHTWIDFDRFLELNDSGNSFSSADYTAPTPRWAQFGADERGFDPAEKRFRKKRNHPNSAAASSAVSEASTDMDMDDGALSESEPDAAYAIGGC